MERASRSSRRTMSAGRSCGSGDITNRRGLDLVLRLMHARRRARLLDVGANIGWYSCAQVAAVPDSIVVAIEPDCVNCAALRKNLAGLGRSEAVVVNAAVGSRFEPVRIARRASSRNSWFGRGGSGRALPGSAAPTWVAAAAVGRAAGQRRRPRDTPHGHQADRRRRFLSVRFSPASHLVWTVSGRATS